MTRKRGRDRKPRRREGHSRFLGGTFTARQRAIIRDVLTDLGRQGGPPSTSPMERSYGVLRPIR